MSSLRKDLRLPRQLELHSQETYGSSLCAGSSFESCNEGRSNLEFRTPLTFVDASDPRDVQGRRVARSVRSHAIRTALAKKRFEEQERGSHFRLQKIPARNHYEPAGPHRQNFGMPVTSSLSRPLGPASIDPFETLSVDAQRLTALFHLKSSLSAGEPVFSINDAIHYQSLYSTFETGLDDGALAAAITSTLSYAASGWQTTSECVKFSSIAMHQLRQKLVRPYSSTSPATIGTILLLLGNAYRIGELRSAQTHLDGLGSLLRICQQRTIQLPSALKRAIYWQDLFSSIFLGTDRIVNYEEFYPGQDLDIKHIHQNTYLPVGFARSAHLLNPEVTAAARDVASLYADRQHWIANRHLPEVLRGLDNIQARAEGHLHTLRQGTSDSLLICCVIALQLCVYGFWDGVWNAALIPRELSTKLLHHLRDARQHDFGKDGLFLWLIYVGKAFAIDESVRTGLDDLWISQHSNKGVSVFPPWDEANRILSGFVWSEVLFCEARGWFWERIGG